MNNVVHDDELHHDSADHLLRGGGAVGNSAGMKPTRVDIWGILSSPEDRRELMVRAIMAIQAREGIPTTKEQAERAYDKVVRVTTERLAQKH